MSDRELEALRRHGFAVAYRMLGSVAEAEDMHTCFDRRDFGFEWQMELPGDGNAVGWDVGVDIDLLLMRDDPAAKG
jgi:hypothetical protein